MKTYKTIVNDFITENDIRCIPDSRGNVWFYLVDVVRALKLDIDKILNHITIICYTIHSTDILCISRNTIEFLITQSDTKYSREIFRSSSYKYKWFK